MSDARASPHTKLISIAAELVRGPHLDERFDLDDRLPKWALANIERICERQRQLAIIVRVEVDRLAAENEKLRAQLDATCENFAQACRENVALRENLRLARVVVEAAREEVLADAHLEDWPLTAAAVLTYDAHVAAKGETQE